MKIGRYIITKQYVEGRRNIRNTRRFDMCATCVNYSDGASQKLNSGTAMESKHNNKEEDEDDDEDDACNLTFHSRVRRRYKRHSSPPNS